jgi:hypothetical protein
MVYFYLLDIFEAEHKKLELARSKAIIYIDELEDQGELEKVLQADSDCQYLGTIKLAEVFNGFSFTYFLVKKIKKFQPIKNANLDINTPPVGQSLLSATICSADLASSVNPSVCDSALSGPISSAHRIDTPPVGQSLLSATLCSADLASPVNESDVVPSVFDSAISGPISSAHLATPAANRVGIRRPLEFDDEEQNDEPSRKRNRGLQDWLSGTMEEKFNKLLETVISVTEKVN